MCLSTTLPKSHNFSSNAQDESSAEFNFTDGHSTWAVDMLVPDDSADGFAAWARDMRMILRAQGLGACVDDAASADAAAQRRAVTSVYFSVTVPFRAAVEGAATAGEAFAKLEAEVQKFGKALEEAIKEDK